METESDSKVEEPSSNKRVSGALKGAITYYDDIVGPDDEYAASAKASELLPR